MGGGGSSLIKGFRVLVLGLADPLVLANALSLSF